MREEIQQITSKQWYMFEQLSNESPKSQPSQEAKNSRCGQLVELTGQSMKQREWQEEHNTLEGEVIHRKVQQHWLMLHPKQQVEHIL